jgi:hypothetical protein
MFMFKFMLYVVLTIQFTSLLNTQQDAIHKVLETKILL